MSEKKCAEIPFRTGDAERMVDILYTLNIIKQRMEKWEGEDTAIGGAGFAGDGPSLFLDHQMAITIMALERLMSELKDRGADEMGPNDFEFCV